ncbi:MAG: DUF5686 and carboxypeptidase regulatory-like domain-containing protein [Mediterranea sp.]|jgi:hypothetical protein|nr:DUF5686 and carboxypeptidase regulatory-like domain-containing protein [Mediterranea sp.]
MAQRYYKTILFLLLILIAPQTFSQIRGVITDSLTNEPLMYISVFYKGKGVGTISNTKGEYMIGTCRDWNELTFSAIGYHVKVVRVEPGMKILNIRMSPADILLSEVVVKPQRNRYSRKNNPAVDFMRKVIERKSRHTLEENDYYRYDKYQKMKTSLNDVTPEGLEKGIFRKMPFMKDRIEVSPESRKMILPLSIQETASEVIYRKSPASRKTIIKGMCSHGIDELFSTGDMIGTVLNDVFTDINIYDNDIRFLQERFVSPISGSSAISFYKYYLMDTVVVDKYECVHLAFVPQNVQEFGFSGHLYVVNDSTYAVKKCRMSLPKNTGVNFVERLDIIQEFERLPNGNWVLTGDDMVVDLSLIDIAQGAQVRRTTRYGNYSFEPVEANLFKKKGEVIKELRSRSGADEFWVKARQAPLTGSEKGMDSLVDKFHEISGFNYVLTGLKALVEGYIETGSRKTPGKFDIGPVNTFISGNYIDGTRLRAGGQTTAQFNPHWFYKGYAAYGFRDRKWKYEGAVTYAFDRREFFPWEFPRHNLSAGYRFDVMSPMDKFLTTDKDNVFVAWKVTTVDQMSYVRDVELKYELETMNGFSVTTTLRRRNDEPAGKLQYLRNDAGATPVHDITTAEWGVTLSYSPGQTYMNTKQRRRPVTLDAPVYTLSHTAGFKGALDGDYTFNLTEAGVRRRFWLSSWGKADVTLKAGVQWNKAPFPLLILPAANLSYIAQKETFNLMNNMEFLNDRYASFFLTYDMNGKLLNHIPLLKKLKWREVLRFRTLWGELSDRNNPYKNPGDGDLFLFPMRDGETTGFVMNPKKPYMEVSAGIYNIFKILHIEYVRRLNYLENPDTKKHGVRFMIIMTF